MLAFELYVDNSPDAPFPLWPRGHNVHNFQKIFEMWTRQTTEHFSTLHQPILDELGPREADGVSGCCWYMAFALHSRVLTCTYRCSHKLYLLPMVFWSVPEPMLWYPLHIDVGFWCRGWFLIHQRDQRSQAFSVGFRPCRLRAEISPDSLNFLMILWTVDDEIPKFLAIVRWETLFLNCLTICSRSCSQSGEPRPILTCEWLSLSGMLFLYPIMAPNCSQLTCSPVGCFKQVFDRCWMSIPQPSQSFLPPVPAFL